ncbi:LegC family aminotransferase [Candidatus Thioglobus sp.]|nr:LegC family aminotransferase [Candidatus Thioglobus sp.]
MFDDVIDFIQDLYPENKSIPLHEPRFSGNEKKYLNECIDSTFVSSVGKFVDGFEERIAHYTGAKYAITTNNGTSAFHTALLLANVMENDEVITQPLAFVATCNAISYCNASPIFVDVDKDTMGMSPISLEDFLKENAIIENQQCINKVTGKVIKACAPIHTFGHPCRIDYISNICKEWCIALVEDSAESLGSYYKKQHTGTFGDFGILSFNGNKVITSGGGGCILTNNEDLARKAKHITTTAKEPHKWEFVHDMIGYNYRMPNLNAALIVAQLEQLDGFLKNKRLLANSYKEFFQNSNIKFVTELEDSVSNYWLNAVILKDKAQRDLFLDATNSKGVMTRPIWTLMNKLTMFKDFQCGDLTNAKWLEQRIVNIPSSVTL